MDHIHGVPGFLVVDSDGPGNLDLRSLIPFAFYSAFAVAWNCTVLGCYIVAAKWAWGLVG